MPPQKNILAILAHPDDAEIFCAGTLALLAEQGHRIVIATMTPGHMGSVSTNAEETASIRKKEGAAAAQVIGATYHCLEQLDGFVFDNPEIRLQTIDLIRTEKADVVFAHLPNDYHPDHRAASAIVEAATLMAALQNVPVPTPALATTPHLYHTTLLNLTDHLGHPHQPDFYVDIQTVIDTKRQMIEAHESQISLMRHMFGKERFVEDMLDDHDRKLGAAIGSPFAEAFIQHGGSGFPHSPWLQTALDAFIGVER